MAQPLSERTIALVKATVPALEAHGLAITRRMYEHLFQDAEIRALFNQSHHGENGAQPKALTAAILAYGRNIDNLAVLAPAVERIAQKHAGLMIQAEHYPHVARALLQAIRDVLGGAATDEILAAWGEAYWFLAELLIGREAALYRELAAAPGGWNGWRRFRVERKVEESAIITSFHLRPEDGGKVLRHRPGQYLTFRLDVPGEGTVKRNYSISSPPNDELYRITVKREPGGLASGWLHGGVEPGHVLEAAPPAGDFFLQDADNPVVLLSGGVGLTPMISMLETVARSRPGLPVHYVHGTLNGATHAMGPRTRALQAAHANIDVTTFYAEPRATDVRGRDFDEAGLIGPGWLERHTPIAEAEFYLCGPKPFLRALVGGLARAHVPASRIHYEFFGPADELLAA
jgi:nitric oxide dioxygenase